MNSKPRRTLAATELRVRLGEALRALEEEDLVIERGGIPVALLIKYVRLPDPRELTLDTASIEPLVPARARIGEEYERALARRAEPEGWKRMDGAIEAGWEGIDADELVANIYRWREVGRTIDRDAHEDEMKDPRNASSGVSSGQRYLYQRPAETTETYVADRDDSGYQA